VARADAREPAALAVPGAAPRRGARRSAGIDVDEVLRRVERRIRELVEPRVRLLVRTGPEPALARDPGVPLESLLLTLVGHAVDAMPTGGTLTLSAASLAGDATRYVTLSVAHTGRGPDADALARAFDPGRSHARDGLGLASLVRALRRGGGDLSVEVDPARGSTFTVFLPAGPRPVRAAQAAREALAPPPPPGH
jgi:signal transduction histidine kinase